MIWYIINLKIPIDSAWKHFFPKQYVTIVKLFQSIRTSEYSIIKNVDIKFKCPPPAVSER